MATSFALISCSKLGRPQRRSAIGPQQQNNQTPIPILPCALRFDSFFSFGLGKRKYHLFGEQIPPPTPAQAPSTSTPPTHCRNMVHTAFGGRTRRPGGLAGRLTRCAGRSPCEPRSSLSSPPRPPWHLSHYTKLEPFRVCGGQGRPDMGGGFAKERTRKCSSALIGP